MVQFAAFGFVTGVTFLPASHRLSRASIAWCRENMAVTGSSQGPRALDSYQEYDRREPNCVLG